MRFLTLAIVVLATTSCFSTPNMAAALKLDCPLAFVSAHEVERTTTMVRYEVEGCGREAKIHCPLGEDGDFTGQCERDVEPRPKSTRPATPPPKTADKQPKPVRPRLRRPAPKRERVTVAAACMSDRRAVAAFAAGKLIHDLTRPDVRELTRRANELAKETNIPIEVISVNDMHFAGEGLETRPYEAMIGIGVAWVMSGEGQGVESYRSLTVAHTDLAEGMKTAERITEAMWKRLEGVGTPHGVPLSRKPLHLYAMICGPLSAAKLWLPNGATTFVQMEGPPYRAISVEPGDYQLRVQYD